MNLLLDECLPRKLKFLFSGYQCTTVREAGFGSKENGVPVCRGRAALPGSEIIFQPTQRFRIGLSTAALRAGALGFEHSRFLLFFRCANCKS